MVVSFLNITYYFRCFSLGNQREALLCLGRCARFAWPAGGATSTYPMMLLSQRVPFGQYFFGHTKMACGTLFLNFGHQILPIFSQAYIFLRRFTGASIFGSSGPRRSQRKDTAPGSQAAVSSLLPLCRCCSCAPFGTRAARRVAERT